MIERIDPKTIERQTRIKEIDNFVDESQKTNAFGDSFASGLHDIAKGKSEISLLKNEEIEKLLLVLKEKFSGFPLVELGCGVRNLPPELLAKLDVKDYTAVDKYQDFIIDEHFERDIKEAERNGINYKIASEDMLKFVARLEDNSVNFTMSGIDSFIIKDKKYWDYLVKEIHRAMRKDGVIVGDNFEPRIFLSKENLFRRVFQEAETIFGTTNYNNDGFAVLEKIS